MKVGIAGVGNLGSSLLDGLTFADIARSDIIICEQPEYVDAVCKKHRVMAVSDLNELIENCDIIFITLKGYVFETLTVKKPISPDKTIVSLMAGVPFEKLRAVLGDCRIVRAMPTLTVATKEGVIGYTKAPPEVEAIFKDLGYAFECAPDDIEKVMAFSACGLGFAAYLIDAFKKAGQALGFSEKDADKIAEVTFRGAVERGGFAETVKAVATKGGATEQGVLYMDANNTYDIITGAVQKAYERMI